MSFGSPCFHSIVCKEASGVLVSSTLLRNILTHCFPLASLSWRRMMCLFFSFLIHSGFMVVAPGSPTMVTCFSKGFLGEKSGVALSFVFAPFRNGY